MAFAGQVRHILLGLLACLTLICLSAAYWAIAGRASLLQRDDNPRRIEALAKIQRGSVIDRQGRVLAHTVSTKAGLSRRYPLPATYSIVGYSSLRYGVGGVEAAYDALLAGQRPLQSLADYVNRQILRLPQVGADIMLSIDAGIQATLAAAMGDAAGGAIVIDARRGGLLALLSLPSYDPNRLDEDWAQLVEAEGNPFFNRALQGNYQLGGNIYAMWLAQALAAGFDLSTRFTGASEAVTLDDGTLMRCLVRPGSSELNLPEALAHGCPAPFRSLPQSAAADYAELIAAFRIDEPASLAGFPQPEPIAAPAAIAALEPSELALRNSLGQGEATASPLHIASIMAAIANDGLAIAPWIHAATREPHEQAWQETSPVRHSRRLLEADTARELQATLRAAWGMLAGSSPSSEVDVGAYLALSQSGDQSQLWLNGFVPAGDETAAFVILLEDSADVERILAIGSALVDALRPGH